MKKTLLFIIITISFSCVKAQDSKFKEKKVSILKEILASQEYLQSIINLGTLDETPIKFSTVIPLNPKPITLPNLKINFDKIESKIKDLKWTQYVIDDITIISFDKTNLSDYLNVNFKKIVIENIAFFDNKISNKKVEIDDFYRIEFPVDIQRKRIKSFDLKIFIKAEEYLNFTMNINKTSIDSLQIKNFEIKDKTISFQKKESNSNSRKAFEIFATDNKGLFYKSISSSSITKLTDKDIEYYKAVLVFLEDLKKALNKNKFKNEKQFKKYVEKNKVEEVVASEKIKLYNFDFSVYPNDLLFRVLEKEYISVITTSFSKKSIGNKFIAKSEYKYGLIDNEGNWIIKPIYDYLSENKYFTDFYNCNDGKTIWLNPETGQIIEYDFKIVENSMRIEKWFKTGEYTSSKGVGLFDVINKKIILPVDRKNSLSLYSPYFIVKKHQENGIILEGVYDFEGNLIFDFDNQEIKVSVQDLFSIKKNNKVHLYKFDTISNKTRLLTSRDYSSISLPFYRTSIEELQEDPLFQANKSNNGTPDYLTVNGEIAIDGEKYSRAIGSYDRYIMKDKKGVFSILDKYGKLLKTLDINIIPKTEYSAYLLQVKNKKTGLYGYLDKKGDLVIPFMYSRATRFVKFKNESLAKASVSTVDKEGNETSYFIDTNNNVIGEKKFYKKGKEVEHSIESN